MHTFELAESGGRELLQGMNLTNAYNDLSTRYTGYNNNNEIYLTGKTSIGSDYITISPTNKTYYYDIEISSTASNQIYIGFTRFDANKTATTNSSAIYVISTSAATDHTRYKGTVDLSTDLNGNPTAFIKLRILNDWIDAPSDKTLIVHHLSLREVTTLQTQKIQKFGTVLTDEFRQYNKPAFFKNGFIEATDFIER